MAKSQLALSVLDLVPAFGRESDAASLQRAIELAAAAERLGYRRYWAAEHHDLPSLACAAPETLLAAVGAPTERIRLGTGALLLPHYKPLKVAETFHLLAALYPGRVDLGIGRAPGGNAHAAMALSGNVLDNIRRFPDLLRDLSALLRGEFTCEGEPVRAQPTPPSPPEPWLLGTNAKSAAYAAEFGMGYVFGQFMSDVPGVDVIRAYRESFVPSAFFPKPRAMIAVGVVCADSAEQARELSASAARLTRPPAQQTGSRGVPPGADVPADAERFADAAAAPSAHEAAEADAPNGAGRGPIAGTPSEVRRRLDELAAAHGVDELLVTTTVADPGARLRSYELLAREML